jgi:tetratricopeptide (TPR) repeat protein
MPKPLPPARVTCAIALLASLGLSLLLTPAASRADALLDAKRSAAEKLLHDGKYDEGIALMKEVLQQSDSGFNDHLLLARAYEKTNQPAEAIKEYKRVLALVPGSPTAAAERAARLEADKRLKVLDPVSPRIDAAVDEIERKLDGLERDAITARSMSGLERVFRLRGALWVADKRPEHAFVEVMANGVWQDAGLDVTAKHTYHVRAAGTWRIKGNGNGGQPLIECTAAGTDKRPPNGFGKRGQLLAMVNGKPYPLGEDAHFTPEASGKLQFIVNDDTAADRAHNQGSVQVLVDPN